jgi:cell division protein FtsW
MAASLVGVFCVWDALISKSASLGQMFPSAAIKQIAFVAIGAVLGIAISRVPRDLWRRLAWPAFVLSVASLVAVMMFGQDNNGSQRWLVLGPIQLQTSEFVKLGAVVFLAGVLAFRKPIPKPSRVPKTLPEKIDMVYLPRAKSYIPVFLALGLVVLIERQPDLGTAAVILVFLVSMLLAAGVHMKRILGLIGLMGVGVLGMVVLEPYRIKRFMAVLHMDDPAYSATNYQAQMSIEAFQRGGLFGVGIGEGQVKDTMPVIESDFIMALIGEEFGLFGAFLILALVGAVAFRILFLARGLPMHPRLILVGAATWIGVQAGTNVMMATGVFPTIGLPMPFISLGGSSLIALWLMVGVCQSCLVKQPKKQKEVSNEASSSRRRNRRSYLPSS